MKKRELRAWIEDLNAHRRALESARNAWYKKTVALGDDNKALQARIDRMERACGDSDDVQMQLADADRCIVRLLEYAERAPPHGVPSSLASIRYHFAGTIARAKESGEVIG